MVAKKKDINNILARWNPIGVDDNIAKEEYQRYVSSILEVIGNRQQLKNCLEQILVNKLGLEYDPGNIEHSKDLENICDELMNI